MSARSATPKLSTLGSSPRPLVAAITGASGLVGRHLVDALRKAGWEARALVRDTGPYVWKEPGVRAYGCDLPSKIDPRGLEGARLLVHCAYMTKFTSIEEARAVNEEGTRAVVASAREAGVERCYFISSQSAHEAAVSYYGRSKLALEALFDRSQDAVFRSGLVLGKEGAGLFHRLAGMVRGGKVIPLFGGGRQPIQTVHVEDLCAAILAAWQKDLGGTFIVAEPEARSLKALLQLMAARLGKRPLFVPFPVGPMLLFLKLIERLHLPFPVSSENLLGLTCLRADDTRPHLERLGVTVRSAGESLEDVLAPS